MFGRGNMRRGYDKKRETAGADTRDELPWRIAVTNCRDERVCAGLVSVSEKIQKPENPKVETVIQ